MDDLLDGLNPTDRKKMIRTIEYMIKVNRKCPCSLAKQKGARKPEKDKNTIFFPPCDKCGYEWVGY